MTIPKDSGGAKVEGRSEMNVNEDFSPVSDAPSPHESAERAHRRRASRPRSLAEQIADEVGAEILDGIFGASQRVGEQELAKRYGVSRGPVREAIRILEKRGLVEFYPRRGAFAVEHSLNLIADMFNTQAALTGLIARCFARSPTKEGLADVEAQIQILRQMNISAEADIIEFSYQSTRVVQAMSRHCGNEYLLRLSRSSIDRSIWDFMWRRQPLDYLSQERRSEGIRQWELILEASRHRDDREAERIAQQVLFDSRDSALTILGRTRRETVTESRLLSNVRTP